jgi:hypothetical protein
MSDYNIYGTNGGVHLITEGVPREDVQAHIYHHLTQGWVNVHGIRVCKDCQGSFDFFSNCGCPKEEA